VLPKPDNFIRYRQLLMWEIGRQRRSAAAAHSLSSSFS